MTTTLVVEEGLLHLCPTREGTVVELLDQGLDDASV